MSVTKKDVDCAKMLVDVYAAVMEEAKDMIAKSVCDTTQIKALPNAPWLRERNFGNALLYGSAGRILWEHAYDERRKAVEKLEALNVQWSHGA